MKKIQGGVCAPLGFNASGVHCGIRKNKTKEDLALIVSDVTCSAAAVYTTNKVKGAPIAVTKKNLENGRARAVICNSGNANTCNADGVEKAERMCALTSEYTGIPASDVIVASTGVIGQILPIEPIEGGMQALADGLSVEGAGKAARAIMTTDTVAKEFAAEDVIGGKIVRVGAMAKGSGMIHPNMATLLCFVTTDAAVSPEMLDKALHAAVADTLNMVSIDGDTSTNDMLTVMASGLSGMKEIDGEGEDYEKFLALLTAVLTDVSRAIAKDGEGATRLLECKVTGAPDVATAKKIAKSVVCSSLLKAAISAADANWGRVLCAIGYTDAQFDIDKIDVDLSSEEGSIAVCRNGSGVEFDEDEAKKILTPDEVTVNVNCNIGSAAATAWGCDLTCDYVKINADYRT